GPVRGGGSSPLSRTTDCLGNAIHRKIELDADYEQSENDRAGNICTTMISYRCPQILLIVSLLVVCACNREKPLPNGYRLTVIEQVPQNYYLILNEKRDCVVPENITRLGCHESLVIGFVESVPQPPGAEIHGVVN